MKLTTEKQPNCRWVGSTAVFIHTRTLPSYKQEQEQQESPEQQEQEQ